MKKTTKLVLMSVLTIAMCVSLIAGATFALFTDNDSVNIAVSSGSVKIEAHIDDSFTYTSMKDGVPGAYESDKEFLTGGSASVTANGGVSIENMVPGDKVEFDIVVTNESSVAIQYRTTLTSLEDKGLMDALVITIGGVKFDAGIKLASTAWTPVKEAKGAIAPIHVAIELPVETDDNYQDVSCELLAKVEAVQGNAKPNELIKLDDTHYIANSAGSLLAFAEGINSGSIIHNEAKQVVLTITEDIDLANVAWAPINGLFVSMIGNGHTISNISADGYQAGLFGYLGGGRVENLTIHNATLSGQQVGAVAGHIEGAVLSNVTLSGNIMLNWNKGTSADEAGLGVFTGIWVEGNVSGLTITSDANIVLVQQDGVDSKFEALADEDQYFGRLFDNCTAPEAEVTKEAGASIIEGVAAAEADIKGALASSGEAGYVVASEDIDMSAEAVKDTNGNITLEIGDGKTLDLAGHTITRPAGGSGSAVYFAKYTTATLKNGTIDTPANSDDKLVNVDVGANVVFENVIFINHGDDAITFKCAENEVTTIKFINCTFINAGVNCASSKGDMDIEFIGCTFEGSYTMYDEDGNALTDRFGNVHYMRDFIDVGNSYLSGSLTLTDCTFTYDATGSTSQYPSHGIKGKTWDSSEYILTITLNNVSMTHTEKQSCFYTYKGNKTDIVIGEIEEHII